jgi:hypothetical protein
MVTWPSFVMLSLGGFLGAAVTTPFLLVGFVQYFSNMKSVIHLERERRIDSAMTPLFPVSNKSQHNSATKSDARLKRVGILTFPGSSESPSRGGFRVAAPRLLAAACPAGSIWGAALVVGALPRRRALAASRSLSSAFFPCLSSG